MSKKVAIETYNSNGVDYGQKQRAADVINIQKFAHEHTETLTSDVLTREERASVGFDYSLPANSNSRQITVLAPGRIYETSGLQFDFPQNAPLTVDPAETGQFLVAQNRIDAIVARLEIDVESAAVAVPFRRIRSQEELEDNIPPYPETQFNRFEERRNRAFVEIKKGIPSSAPVPPVLAQNEVLLYLVNVAANTDVVRREDIVDLRPTFNSLRRLDKFVGQLLADYANLQRDVEKLKQGIDKTPVDLTVVFGEIRSLGEILILLKRQIDSLRQSNPEIIRQGLLLSDPANGKLDAAGAVDNNMPVVDIEIGAKVRFGGAEFDLSPNRFTTADAADRSPRLARVDNSTQNETLETALALANVIEINSDGQTDFGKRNSEFVTARSRPAVCSRGAAANQGQYVEMFGGLALNNNNSLGDWYSYNVVTDVLTPRAFSGATPPNSERPAMFTIGDGHVLLGCGNSNSNARWFKFNAETGASVEITGTKPTGINFFGDKITNDKILIVAQNGNFDGIGFFWIYDTVSNTFTQLNTVGATPPVYLDYSHGCFFSPGYFALVNFTPGVSGSGTTFIFEYSSLTWRKLTIASPYLNESDKQRSIPKFRMANVGGRVLLVGGLLQSFNNPLKSRVWELAVGDYISGQGAPTPRGWDYFDGNFPLVQDIGFCTTFTSVYRQGERLEPKVDRAVIAGGTGQYSNALKEIYSSILGGLVSTVYNGEPAITLSDSATFAEFILPLYTASWDVAGYFASFIGQFEPEQIQMAVSFNNGLNYHPVVPEQFLAIADSLNPGKRLLRVTLYSYQYNNAQGQPAGGNARPILAKLKEIFDADGTQLNIRTVLRFNVNAADGIQAMYLDNTGKVTFSDAIEPSSFSRCLLLKITPNGALAPMVKKYVNRKRARVRYSKTKLAGNAASAQFENDLAVPAAWVEANGIKASDSHLYHLEPPVIGFDDVITVAGVTDGDKWEVEVEG